MSTIRTIACAVALVGLGCIARGEDALEVAKKVTSEGAKIIASKNVAAIMATYAEDSRVSLVKRNESTGGLQPDVHTGKTEIQKLYEDLFKTEGAIDARNNVEFARFVGPDLLLIGGTIELSAGGGQTSSFAFVQVRTRQGDKWLLTDVQIFVGPAN